MRKNPVLTAELRRAYRSPKVFFSRAGFALALTAVLSLGFRHMGATQESGRQFFYLVVLTEAALAYLTAPAFCAGALAAERRAGTLGVLLTSGLRPRDIVWGKLLGRSALVGLMVLSAAPVLAAALFAGGVSPFEVVGTSALVLSGSVLLSAIALYAAAAGAGFFGALLAAYLGFLLLEVGGACCIAIPGNVLTSATAGGGRAFMAGSHVLSLGTAAFNPVDFTEISLVFTLALSVVASWGLATLGARHLQIHDLPPLPPPPPRPPKPGAKKKVRARGALHDAPLLWLEQRGTAVEFLIVPALLALYGLFVLLLLVLNDPESLRRASLQYGAVAGSGALLAALLIITGAAAFARDHEDKIADQLLCTPLTAWQFLVERFVAELRKLWAFAALPFAMVVGLALLGGPMRSPRALVVLACLAAGAVLAFGVGVLFGLKQRRRGPAVSWALAAAVCYWAIAPLFVSLSALAGNPVAEWLVRAANPFRVMYDALMVEDTAAVAAIGALVIVGTTTALGAYLAKRFGPLAGRVE